MISQRTFTYLSYVLLAIMAFSLALVAFRLVPQSWYEYMFAGVLGLFLVRIAFRLILARQARLANEEKVRGEKEAPPPAS
jgi:uncharacterized membrane protein